ncbi:hypothetical protein Sjap_007911 [Stephania japonica]|uniref:F-box domain-containing protein n=1 Tax=Stephania japonica TaxID=461633 RepID=A0AAP0PAV4_9MAGN
MLVWLDECVPHTVRYASNQHTQRERERERERGCASDRAFVPVHSIWMMPTRRSQSDRAVPRQPTPSASLLLLNGRSLGSFVGLFISTTDPSLDLSPSLERVLESRASSDQERIIHGALTLGSLLLKAANHSQRKRFSDHNSLAWILPNDLTVKVFSMLDTESLCHAAAACSMFHKCAMDSLCYAEIDLRSILPKVNNAIVNTMVQRAGKNLRSLKLGVLPVSDASQGSSRPIVYTFRNSTEARFSWNDRRSRQGKESYVLTRSCLASLSADGGSAGAMLRKLYLYNIDKMDNAALSATLSACPSLLDLEIVGLCLHYMVFFLGYALVELHIIACVYVFLFLMNNWGCMGLQTLNIALMNSHVELKQTLESLSANCHLLQRLFCESSKTGRDDSLKSQTCVDLVNGCPLVTSLSLRGFKLLDYKIRVLLKGFRKLKVADFSTSYSITGSFLRNLGSGTTGNLLELEVAPFLHAVLAGNLKFLRHLDISNKEGLASDSDWYDRCYSPSSIPMDRFAVERPEIQLLAKFPPEGSSIEIEHMLNSEVNSDSSSPSQISSPSSDVSSFMTSSESSYNSDQGSGNEDGHHLNFQFYEESSDEVDDFLAI